MTESYARDILRLITDKFQVPRVALKITTFPAHDNAYVYNVDKPHNPYIVLSKDTNCKMLRLYDSFVLMGYNG